MNRVSAQVALRSALRDIVARGPRPRTALPPTPEYLKSRTGYHPVYAGSLKNAAQESFVKLVVAITRAGGGCSCTGWPGPGEF